jgi:glycosyltransferase A (GT-A) superfamily protein (DUF2064 family)
MSTPHVTTETLNLAAEENLRVELLPAWYDVDNAAALSRLAEELAELSTDIARHTRAFFATQEQFLSQIK